MSSARNGQVVTERKRAVLRLAFGQAQMIGATVTAILLIQTGVSVPVICGVTATALISLTSILLFHVIWKKRPNSQIAEPDPNRRQGPGEGLKHA